MNVLREKFKNNPYMNERLRFLLFAFSLFLILFLARYLLGMAYARYEVRTKINADIDKALYIFEDEKLAFNLEPDGIVPSDDNYTYRFSVSNFTTNKESDVDITYQIKVKTTTNLPITVKMYRNELPDAAGATNILSGASNEQDEDNAWYHLYTSLNYYDMNYSNHTTDVYTMVIEFPSSNGMTTTYARMIEHIQVILESKQIV